VRRRHALGAAALGAGVWCAPALAPHAPPLAAIMRVPRRVAAPRGVALTFDDGPHPQGTPAVLELLANAQARATFFLVGEQVERWPSLAAEIAAAGHEVALHGYRHTLLLRRTPRALASDLERAAALIERASGRAPRCYRPPYGIFSPTGLALVRRRGWQPLLWSRWGRDWERRATPQAIARRATRRLAAGDVVLLHDADYYSSAGSWRRTVAALPAVIEAVAQLGTSFALASQPT
jgi:peptidoglycan/xylan/chitin deacetylase (PgdA/CDA1 family)